MNNPGGPITKNNPVYQKSKNEFRKKATAIDYTEKPEGWEEDGSRKSKGIKGRDGEETMERKSAEKDADKFYKQSVAARFDDLDRPDDNVEKAKKVDLKKHLKFHRHKIDH